MGSIFSSEDISTSCTYSYDSLVENSLLCLPTEIIKMILWFVGDEYRDALVCTRVCHLFRDLITTLRTTPKDPVPISDLRTSPWIRSVDGPIVLDRVENLRKVLGLEGNLHIFFPRTPVVRKGRSQERWKWTFFKDMKVCGNPYMGLMISETLNAVRRRILDHPKNSITVVIDKTLRIHWEDTRCHLRIPVCAGWGEEPWTSEIQRNLEEGVSPLLKYAICKFLREIPITHLSYLPFTVYNGILRPTDDPLFWHIILKASKLEKLTSLSLPTDIASPLTRHIQSERTNPFPHVTTLKLHTIPPGAPNRPLRDFNNLRSLPHFFTSNITRIDGRGFLVFPSRTSTDPDSLLDLFPKVNSWRVLLLYSHRFHTSPHGESTGTSNADISYDSPREIRTVRRIHTKDLESFLSSVKNPQSSDPILLFQEFRRRHEGRKFRVWCLE